MLSSARVKDFWLLLDKYKDFKELTDAKYLWGDLKEYQRLFVLDQLLKMPRGSRIAEIGGGVCNVFEAILKKYPGLYECWSIDPLEGQGGGPVLSRLPWDTDGKVRLVRENIGAFSTHLPNEYFDVVFSLSVMEHIPLDRWEECFRDTVRICKNGGMVFHSVDVPVDSELGRNRLNALKELPAKVGLKLVQPDVSFDLETVIQDEMTYYVSPAAYARWLEHMPVGQNSLTTGIFKRITAFNAVYVRS